MVRRAGTACLGFHIKIGMIGLNTTHRMPEHLPEGVISTGSPFRITEFRCLSVQSKHMIMQNPALT